MDFSSQESIKEVICPICQELLTEPMSLDCGHSFCQACITAHSESGSPLGWECCCPVCQSRYQPWNLQFNWQLAEKVKKFREVDMSSQQLRRRDLCEHHGENYDIFCKDDGKAICRLCVQEHQGHQVSPIMEVVKECQEKFQEALKKLSQEQQEAEQLEADINEERVTWKKHMQTERERILQGFEEMRGILDKEEQRELQKLEEDEVNVLDNLTVAKDQMVQQKQYMSELVSDLQRHMRESTVDMLQDVINILRRCEIYNLKKPKIVSNKLKSAFQVPDLSGILQKFKEIYEPEESQMRTERSRGAAVMASGILLNIKEEVTCPICLELLTEPLTLCCGHTFCQACITVNNKESTVSQDGESSCPVCRSSYQLGILQPNRHMANIVETLREAKLSPEEEQKTDLCKRHGEKLLLFCKEDGKFICWLCERSQEHRGHHTFLMEEVAEEYKEKLQAALDRLRAEHQEAEKLEADIKEERTSWKYLIQNERQIVQDCFKNLRGILDSEEQKELQKLVKEEGDILRDLEQSESKLVQQSLVLKDLMSELEHRLQGSTVKMLQDVNGIMERSKTFTLKKSKPASKKQRRVFQAPDLSGMLQVSNELADVRRYWVHITLDPPTNKQNVAISADGRQLRYEHHLDANKNASAVLGSLVITSGKHYWEVDVSEKQSWILGVYGKKDSDTSSDQPRSHFWIVRLGNQFNYEACGESSSSNPLILTLSLTVPPHRVGIFLDYDAGTVSFYNVTNHGFLIYKFSSCSFPQKMYPYFSPMTCNAPMTLCSPSS